MRIRIAEANRDRIDTALTFNGRYKIALGYDDIECAIKTAEAVFQLAYHQSCLPPRLWITRLR